MDELIEAATEPARGLIRFRRQLEQDERDSRTMIDRERNLAELVGEPSQAPAPLQSFASVMDKLATPTDPLSSLDGRAIARIRALRATDQGPAAVIQELAEAVRLAELSRRSGQ